MKNWKIPALAVFVGVVAIPSSGNAVGVTITGQGCNSYYGSDEQYLLRQSGECTNGDTTYGVWVVFELPVDHTIGSTSEFDVTGYDASTNQAFECYGVVWSPTHQFIDFTPGLVSGVGTTGPWSDTSTVTATANAANSYTMECFIPNTTLVNPPSVLYSVRVD